MIVLDDDDAGFVVARKPERGKRKQAAGDDDDVIDVSSSRAGTRSSGAVSAPSQLGAGGKRPKVAEGDEFDALIAGTPELMTAEDLMLTKPSAAGKGKAVGKGKGRAPNAYASSSNSALRAIGEQEAARAATADGTRAMTQAALGGTSTSAMTAFTEKAWLRGGGSASSHEEGSAFVADAEAVKRRNVRIQVREQSGTVVDLVVDFDAPLAVILLPKLAAAKKVDVAFLRASVTLKHEGVLLNVDKSLASGDLDYSFAMENAVEVGEKVPTFLLDYFKKG